MELAFSFLHIKAQWVSQEAKRRSNRLWSASKSVLPMTVAEAAIIQCPLAADDSESCCAKEGALCGKELEDALPPYTCTVYKVGYVRLKKELDSGGQQAGNRSWR